MVERIVFVTTGTSGN